MLDTKIIVQLGKVFDYWSCLLTIWFRGCLDMLDTKTIVHFSLFQLNRRSFCYLSVDLTSISIVW